MKTRILALLALPLLFVSFANATTPTTLSGSFTASFTVLTITVSGGNTIITVTETATLSGSLTGTRIAQGSEIIHPDGTFNAHDTGIFTGTINGMSGTLVIDGESSGIGVTGSGNFTVGHGTQGLAGIHAQGPFQFTATGQTTTAGTYSGNCIPPCKEQPDHAVRLPLFFTAQEGRSSKLAKTDRHIGGLDLVEPSAFLSELLGAWTCVDERFEMGVLFPNPA